VADVTPTGMLSLPIENLRILLAASTTFQTLVNAGDAAAAKPYVYVDSIDESVSRPFALVSDQAWNLSLVGQGAVNAFDEGGVLLLEIQAGVGDAYEDDGAGNNPGFEFRNTIGAIVEEMLDLAASGTYLDVSGVRFEVPPTRVLPETEAADEDFFAVRLQLQWGR